MAIVSAATQSDALLFAFVCVRFKCFSDNFSLNLFVSFVQTNFYPNAERSFANTLYMRHQPYRMHRTMDETIQIPKRIVFKRQNSNPTEQQVVRSAYEIS